MGQTPSTAARHDNASTRTLHSSSINSNRPRSFLRRISRRLNTHHPNRRFGRQRTAVATSTLPTHGTSVAPSMTSSVHRATVAATQAAAAATGPIPPLPFLHIDPHPSNSSAASTTSAISNSSEISQLISEIISSAVLSSLSSGQGESTNNNNSNNNNSTHNIQVHDSTSFFRYMQMPMRSHSTQQDQQQQSYSTTSLNDNDQRSETENNNIGQQQTVLPIFIIGYRTIGSVDPPPSTTSNTTTSPTSYTSSLSPLPTYIPAGPHLRRRPRSAISTSSSLATLQSMPMSVQSNRTNHTSQTTLHIQHQHHHTQQQQPQQHHREFLLPSSSSTSSSTSSTTAGTTQGGRWLIYVMSGQHRPYPHDTVHHLGRLSDNPTYEDLLWLSSILGPAHPVTTTQQAIDATLSTFTWSDEITKRSMLQDHTDRCLVCLDDFMPKQTVRVLKCRHVFHVECVDRWLVEAHNSCPICRCVPVAQSNPSPTTTTTTTI